jgi:hypothetical protein
VEKAAVIPPEEAVDGGRSPEARAGLSGDDLDEVIATVRAKVGRCVHL